MAGGFLVSLTPTKDKGRKVTRLLRGRRPVRNMIKTYIGSEAKKPSIQVQFFNSNGYPTRTLKGTEAIDEFNKLGKYGY